MTTSTSFAQKANNLLNVLQGYTNSIRLLLVMFLTLTASTAWGEEATISSFNSTSGKFGDVSYNAYKGGGTSNPAVNSSAIRLYQNASGNTGGYIVLSVPDGYTITSATIKSTMGTTTGYYIDSNPGATTPAKANFEVNNKSLNANTAYTVSGLSTQYITFACFGTSSSSRLYVSYLSVTYQSAAAHTVTWTINPAAGGTLSATSGNSTTVSPNAAYTYGASAYTVTSGAATVSQSGNTFTATPTANSTIQINMVEKPKYTVTLDAGSGSCAASVTETSAGAGVTLPTPTLDGCGEWKFAGWKTTSAVSTETTDEPTLIPAGTYKPTSNINLYAVYQRTETTQGGGSSEEIVDFSSQGYSNQQEVSSYDGTNFSVAFNKGSNSNTPKYYTSGTAIRIYGGGYFTISSESTITKIVIAFGSDDGSNAITASQGTYSNGTWTGSANSVKFTIGGSSGNRRIKSLVVTTTGGGSSTTYYHSTPDCGSTEPTYTLTLHSDLSCVIDGSATVELNATELTNFIPATRDDYTCTGYWSAPSGGVQVLKTDGTFVGENVNGFITDGKWINTTATKLTPRWETEYKMILSKGTEENGTYTLSTTNIETSECATSTTRQVTITATPNTGYEVDQITYNGDGTATQKSGPTLGTGKTTWVYTFAENDKGTGTFTVTFKSLPKYTVSFSTGTGNPTQAAIKETTGGAGITLPTGPTPTCTDWDFAGWATASVSGTTTAPTLLSEGDNYTPASDCILYAVYSYTEAGGGGSDVTFNFSNIATANSWTNGTAYTTVTISPITLNAIGGGNNGKYYTSNTSWRMYNGGSLQISTDIGKITSVSSNPSKTFTINDEGTATLSFSGTTEFTSITVSYSSTTTTYNSNPECGPQKLATPNVNLTYDCSSATITWDAVTNAKAYWYQIIKTGDDNSGESSTNTTYTRNDIEPGVSYTWSVKALGDGSEFLESEIATGTFTAYSIQWLANGELIEKACGKAGEAIVVPSNNPASCDDAKEFVGWTATPIDGSIDTEPNDLFTESPGNITGNATYYAVFATKSTGSGSAELVKMTAYDDFNIGDKIVIIAAGTQYGLYQKTSTSNYIDYWTIQANDGVPTLAEIENDSKRYVEVSAGTANGTIKLGDATNGYLYNSSSTDMSISPNNSSDWSIIAWTDNTFTFEAGQYLSCRTDLSSANKNKWRGAGLSCNCETGNSCSGVIYYNVYKYISGSSTSYSGYVTTCCKQPKTPLTIKADQTELVKNGVVTLTATGGNGTNITWTTTGGVLSNQSNTGATLTISDVASTQNITITATQAENNNDDEVVYCAQEASIDITVKAQWTITFWTNDDGNKESNSMTVTDGDSYTMPDISDEYICTTGHSFVGWVDNEADKELDATPNSTETATADQTWYAAWSSSSNTKSVDIYQLVTNVSNLAAGDKVWITNETPTVAMGVQNENNRGQVMVIKHPTESDKIYSTGSPTILTIGKDGTNYTFHDGTGYLYAASSSSNHLKTKATLDANGKWLINITNEGVASIVSQGTYTRNTIRYNKSNNPPLFSCYASGQSDVKIYKNVGTAEIEVSGASITTNNTSCHRGAVISAENGKWITSSKGQKVRIVINVTARGFNSDATLSATSANEHFSVASITNTAITQNSAFETQMMIEYQPAEANTNENAEITLVAKKGEEVVATRTIDVNGRSLPDEFVIVAQYGDKWLALPANMQSGADQYNGIEVTPNNVLTQIPAAPSTTIYSLRGVADNRYEDAGTCVRLVGNGNKCLWGNVASTITTIQNWTTLASTNGNNYEWLLTTSDGELYTIANPAHPDYDEGRILSNSGSKYGLYKGTIKFYILPVGCSSQPGNIQVTARRVDATFSWEGSASSMKIDVYTNDAMTEGYISNIATASPYYMTGLSESTQYWFKMIPNGTDDDCAYTGSFKTTGPTIDVVEWKENAAVIFVDKDENLKPLVIIDGEVEHGQGSTLATDLFFSKYFEAQGTAKLLAIYNGTANAISLADITILHRSKSDNTPLSLAAFGKTKGWIQPGEEVIVYNVDDRSAIMDCAEDDPTFKSWNNVENNNVAFSGKGTIRLFRGNKCIDIIGAMENGGDIHNITIKPMEGAESTSFGDDKGFSTTTGDDYSTDEEEKNYTLSTNRCLLVRKPFVTSGAIAVEKNIGDFKTLGNDYDGIANEWAGLQVPNGPSDNKYKYTCEGFQEVGSFDYNNYYKEYQNVQSGKELDKYDHNADTKEYIIPIENLAQYSCLNIRFQLKDNDKVVTEQPVQVPIIVKDPKTTADAIFNAIIKNEQTKEPIYDKSIERCKTCNVVVLSEATLTKAANGTANDASQVHNIKIYPGGQLVVPSETSYNVNSLAFRRQEDEVSMANIQGTLNVKHANGVYLDVRIDPSNWHYMTLPYDCRVGDVTFADGTPAVVNTDYLLGWYDGAYRAEHKTGGWTYITDNDYILKKGLGYIVALPGDGKVRREIRFPMANDVIAQDLTSKTVSGLYAYGGDKTDAELRPNHKGWNMIGSPYLYTYTTDIVKEPLQMGTLEHSSVNPWDGTWVRTGDARYIVEPIDNGWSGYEQKTIDYLKPFTSYFIQVGGELENGEYTTIIPETEQQIVFAANSVARNASAPRKVAEVEVTDNHPVWYGVEMIAPNNEKDNTTLLISNEFTDGYDMMDDLVKMRGDYYQYYNFPVLASNNNEGEMAFNALPDSSAAKIGVPLSYYAATAGTYTIATDGRFDLEEVKAAMLYDATTAQYTNLLTENYSFTTNKGNNTNRFTLFVTVERKKVPNITTGMDNLLANGQLSLIAVERTLVLSGLTENADIYVYDMSGKMVTGTHSAGENGIWRTTVPATGVYFVRVNSANSQQTLRTIVK